MMKTCSLALILATFLAVPASAQDYMTVHDQRATAQPTAEKAVVYFVRPSMMGKAIRFWAFANDKPMGLTKGKHYTFTKLSPGTYVFWARGENISALELKVEAGKSYYLRLGARMGGLKARVRLAEISEQDGKRAVGKLKYTTLTDAGLARAREIAAEKFETAKKKAAKRD